MAITFLTNEDGKKFVKSINDIQPDENGNVQITVENPDVDLTGYATEKWVHEGYQPKGEYLTEHQDISGKLDADKLPEAINAALAQAKDSGEFDGYTPVKNVDYFDGQDYVLTENDKNEIAEIAADLVDIPDENSDEVYVLGEGETLSDVPEGVSIVIDIDGEPDFDLSKYVKSSELGSVINTALANSVADWNQTDENAVDFIKNKPTIATDDEIIEMLAQEDMLPVVADSDGAILADENGDILLW